MKISLRTIRHNEPLNAPQIAYIQKRYETLDSRLKKLFSSLPNCGYSFDCCKESEVCTITVSVDNPMVNEDYKISIHNHYNLVDSPNHKELQLSRYRNFTELKNVVMAEVQSKLKEWKVA